MDSNPGIEQVCQVEYINWGGGDTDDYSFLCWLILILFIYSFLQIHVNKMGFLQFESLYY